MKKIVRYICCFIENKKVIYFYVIFLFLFSILWNLYQNNIPTINLNMTIDNIKNGISINLIPFRTLHIYIQYIFMIPHFFIIILGNIMIFMPIGLFLNKNKLQFISIIIFIIIKEMLQFILNIGSFDIDTIILNSVGVILGVIIAKKLKKFLI